MKLSYHTATTTTTIFYDRNDSSYYHTSTVLCPVYPRNFFVIFFVSPVGRDTDFHLIDQGKVGYLYHLQILLYNLQDDNNVNGDNDFDLYFGTILDGRTGANDIDLYFDATAIIAATVATNDNGVFSDIDSNSNEQNTAATVTITTPVYSSSLSPSTIVPGNSSPAWM